MTSDTYEFRTGVRNDAKSVFGGSMYLYVDNDSSTDAGTGRSVASTTSSDSGSWKRSASLASFWTDE